MLIACAFLTIVISAYTIPDVFPDVWIASKSGELIGQAIVIYFIGWLFTRKGSATSRANVIIVLGVLAVIKSFLAIFNYNAEKVEMQEFIQSISTESSVNKVGNEPTEPQLNLEDYEQQAHIMLGKMAEISHPYNERRFKAYNDIFEIITKITLENKKLFSDRKTFDRYKKDIEKMPVLIDELVTTQNEAKLAIEGWINTMPQRMRALATPNFQKSYDEGYKLFKDHMTLLRNLYDNFKVLIQLAEKPIGQVKVSDNLIEFENEGDLAVYNETAIKIDQILIDIEIIERQSAELIQSKAENSENIVNKNKNAK